MFPCVVVASRKARELLFSAGTLLGTFQAGFSMFFCVLDQFVGLREACFAPFLHRGSASEKGFDLHEKLKARVYINMYTETLAPYMGLPAKCHVLVPHEAGAWVVGTRYARTWLPGTRLLGKEGPGTRLSA